MKATNYMPPQAPDIENAIIGLLLTQPNYHDLIPTINKNWFFLTENQDIFDAIAKLYESKKNIDILTVNEFLKNQKKNIEHHVLSNKINFNASFNSFNEYVSIVKEKALQRTALSFMHNITSMAYKDEVLDMINEINNLNDFVINAHIQDVKAVDIIETASNNYKSLVKKVNDRRSGIDNSLKIPLKKLQKTLGGWQPKDLIIIAARPSMGKTAFALFCAKYLAKKNKKVLFFSLEMSKESLVDRMILAECDISFEAYREGYLTDTEVKNYKQVAENFKYLDFKIVDKSNIKSSEIKIITKKEKPDLVIVDYLGLIRNESENDKSTKNEQIGKITKNLKTTAKECDCPIILISQLNRNVESRSCKIPTLSDLRDSGEIEQDADIVIFLSRPGMYEQDDSRLVDISIAKHRNGAIGTFQATHNENITEFYDIDNFESNKTPF